MFWNDNDIHFMNPAGINHSRMSTSKPNRDTLAWCFPVRKGPMEIWNGYISVGAFLTVSCSIPHPTRKSIHPIHLYYICLWRVFSTAGALRIAFEHLSLYIKKHLGQSVAVFIRCLFIRCRSLKEGWIFFNSLNCIFRFLLGADIDAEIVYYYRQKQ